MTRLYKTRPQLTKIHSALRVAINLEFVADETAHLVAHGDEITLIPPISNR